jgi:ATP-dependent Clp protease ATP-binding subunit ClpA
MDRLKKFWKGFTTTMSHDNSESLGNFTPRAQQVLALARRQADRFQHHFVGTEHLLLGLIELGQGTAVNVLWSMGLDLETVRAEVEKQVGTGPEDKVLGNIPYTPRVKKVLSFAAQEARALHHTYVGTEHLLLGILRDGDGVAGRVLKSLDIDIEVTRQHILRELDPNYKTDQGQPGPGPKAESPKSSPDLVDVTKRYDVYCEERGQEVVYRNVLFKGVKKLLHKEKYNQYDIFYEFVEIEQPNGQTLFIARASIKKFHEHIPTPPAASG